VPQSFNAFIKKYKEKKMRRITLSIFAFIICSASIFAQSEPEIMSYKEYGTIKHKRPYVLKFKQGKGELLYLESVTLTGMTTRKSLNSNDNF
jgi:hypothetical protein